MRACSGPPRAASLTPTEARLSLKLDPSGGLLRSFVELNNKVLDRFSADERRQRLGVHSCPGGDHDSTHSADIDYAELLPLLFELHAGSFYLELAGEHDPEAVLAAIAANMRPDQRAFVGVTDPIDPEVETAEQVRDRILLAANHILVAQLDDRRLRLLALRRRQRHRARNGIRKDPRAA